MQTIMIDGSSYASPQEMHSAIKHMLSLPEYYGLNADAFNDVLSERTEQLNLWIFHSGSGDVASALSVIRTVVLDNGGTVKEMR